MTLLSSRHVFTLFNEQKKKKRKEEGCVADWRNIDKHNIITQVIWLDKNIIDTILNKIFIKKIIKNFPNIPTKVKC